MCHYSSFLQEMHCLRRPMNELLKKDAKWSWSRECQQAFKGMKTMLSSDLLLTHFNPYLKIAVAADASNYGSDAVISQVFPDNTEKAICHAARSLMSAECNCRQIEKEDLATISAGKKFHKMLYRHHLTLLTDHKPLLAIFGSKKAFLCTRHITSSAGQPCCWTTASTSGTSLQQPLVRQKHSRLTNSRIKKPEDTVIMSVFVDSEVNSLLTDSIRALPVRFEEVRKATRQDPPLRQVIKYHRYQWPAKTSGELQQFH
ncbi:unnamed protein product [Dibothriocephalus latus]|uniref:Reverse transcriptase/retrotransposon-derived protein RNase H-like domain-containing protein n=1 Tax=Dibothriocephalus latus TaxID=60516 RepID=A0A3P7L7X8_DIBLA|nr:unnamed protein product [Dibothriocephalus latus]